jgi:hypothetical protein
MDLEALGIMLWSILSINNTSSKEMMDWQKDSIYYYNKKLNYNYYYELNASKNNENTPDFIKKYFKIIETVDWNSITPPSDEIYDKILELSELNTLNETNILNITNKLNESNELNKSNIKIKLKVLKTESEKIVNNHKSSKKRTKRLSEKIKKSSKKKKLSEKDRKNIKISIIGNINIYKKVCNPYIDSEMIHINIFDKRDDSYFKYIN